MEELFEDLNRTELSALAVKMGILGASRAAPRENLIHALTELEHVDWHDPLDELRERIYEWQARPEVWERNRMQVAYDHCPECHGCQDALVADCWLDNKHQIT